MRTLPQVYHILFVYKPLDLQKGHIICDLVIVFVQHLPSLLPISGERPFSSGTDMSMWSRFEQSEHLAFLITVIT